jgi:hypothetical protein
MECPSGLTGTVRGLSVADANAIASATRKKDRIALAAKILKACWLSTEDPGPYELDAGAPPRWDTVLQGDVDYVLVMIRVATHGAEYVFKTQCDDTSCREQFEWAVDLVDELPLQKFDEAQRERFKEGNEFRTEAPDTGEIVTFKLPLHSDTKKAAKQRANNRDQLMTLALRTRIKSVEGVENLREFIENLSLSQANELIEQFDEADVGLDTDIEVECPDCGSIQEVSLPLDREFFFPSLQRKKQKRAKARAETANSSTT